MFSCVYICTYIYIYIYIENIRPSRNNHKTVKPTKCMQVLEEPPRHSARHTGVCEKTLLRIRRLVGNSALKTPNLWLDCSFCCWVAWPRPK